jgi:hypothetical protein
VKLVDQGDVVVMVATRPETRPTAAESAEDLQKKFGALPLGKKIATLVQLEAITASETFDAAIEKPLAFGSKAFDSIMNRARARGQAKQADEKA